jgi:CHAT domain-containing protein/tetratricopeptide (TPR) repeat protein
MVRPERLWDRRTAMRTGNPSMHRIVLPAVLACVLTGTATAAPSMRERLDQARTLQSQRQYAASESVATAVRIELERAAKLDTMALAEALYDIAQSRSSRSLYADSVGLNAARQSLALYEASGHGRDTTAMNVHRVLGSTYNALRVPRQALAHYRTAYEIGVAKLGPDHLRTSFALYNLGTTYRRLGELDSALTAFQRSLDIRLRAHTTRDEWVGNLYAEIGLVHELSGDDERAERAYEAAVRSHEEQLGPDDPALDFSLNRIAGFEFRQGDVARVIDYTQRAVDLLAKRRPPDDVDLLLARLNLGQAYQLLGDDRRALAIYEELAPRFERVTGPDHQQALSAKQCLAAAYAGVGDTARALAVLGEMRTRFERDSLRAPSETYAGVLATEADIREQRGDTDLALRLATRARDVNRSLPVPSSEVAVTADGRRLIILARRGAWNEASSAERDLASDLAPLASTGGKNYILGLLYRSEAARLHGRTEEAFRFAQEATRLSREGLVRNVRALADRQALTLASRRSEALDQLLEVGIGSDSLARATWDEVVRWRGVVRAEVARRREPAAAANDTTLLAAHSTWVRAQQRLAQAEVRASGAPSDSATRSEIEALRATADEAERRLVRDFPRLDQGDPLAVGLDSVLAHLPKGAALVGLVVAPRPSGARHIVAFVTTSDRRVRALDLGSSDEIGGLVADWRTKLGDPRPSRSEADCRRAGSLVRRRVWDPIAGAVSGAQDVFLVPEGPLNGLPWDALPAEGNRYRVEQGPLVHVLAAERERVTLASSIAGQGLLAVGGVDFDERSSQAASHAPNPGVSTRALLAACDAAVVLPPLPGTAVEVTDVRDAWQRASAEQVDVLSGGSATEAAFKQMAQRRRAIHIATHGVALEDTCMGAAPGTRGVGGVEAIPAASTASRPPSQAKASARTPSSAMSAPSPWMGREVLLALADANHASEHVRDENEGLLTAEEVTTLDLRGTEWVVLSACYSAAGESWANEGVLGMQRAFHLAGVRTVIASQWSVEDQATREWMRALYESRARGATHAAQAMANASKSVLEQRRRAHRSTHPFYWAAFTASGE